MHYIDKKDTLGVSYSISVQLMKLIFLSFLLFFTASAQSKNLKIKNGNWLFALHISDQKNIEVNAFVKKNVLTITNGVERIRLKNFVSRGDSLIANFLCIIQASLSKRWTSTKLKVIGETIKERERIVFHLQVLEKYQKQNLTQKL